MIYCYWHKTAEYEVEIVIVSVLSVPVLSKDRYVYVYEKYRGGQGIIGDLGRGDGGSIGRSGGSNILCGWGTYSIDKVKLE